MRNQRGIALIMTLLIVALLTITVVEFFYSVEVDSHMARNAVHGLQASLMARSGIAMGEALLLKDADPQVDAFTEDWCPQVGREGRSCQIEDGGGQVMIPDGTRLRVEIFDESGKINVNKTRPLTPAEYKQLLNMTDPTAPPVSQSQEWAQALGSLFQSRGVDAAAALSLEQYWMQVLEPYWGTPSTPGAQYGTPVPGASPGAAAPPTPSLQAMLALDFTSLDDLAGITGGIKQADLRRLRPFVTVLPSTVVGGVNANTASREVLTAILGDGGVVDNIISERQNAPIKDIGSMLSSIGTQPNYKFARSMIRVQSFFYLIRASAIVNINPITGRGGIGRSAEMLVQRQQRAVPGGTQNGTVPTWSLRRLAWQKEGGATLFRPEAESGNGDLTDSTGMSQ
ncbi:MAG TPA: hypothetical protein VMT89_18595 [Candidatus Acidoferrales bacterium]|nr:hypothetical protein [Candidatus Acidoferrales bacterium]